MKKVFKRITVSLMSRLMLCSSRCAVLGSAIVVNNKVSGRNVGYV